LLLPGLSSPHSFTRRGAIILPPEQLYYSIFVLIFLLKWAHEVGGAEGQKSAGKEGGRRQSGGENQTK
ncbi:hypothetical protein COX04_00580, partial [Candidatus Woesebacteria bacterium CG22_combo_CG10-13_8_21_14_all_45_10]